MAEIDLGKVVGPQGEPGVYPDGTTPPDMRIDDAGHLILTI